MSIRRSRSAQGHSAVRQLQPSLAHLQQQLTAAQLDRITAFHRQRIKRYDWASFTPEQQQAIRELVDSAALSLRMGMV